MRGGRRGSLTLAGFVLVALALTLVACGDDDDDGGTGSADGGEITWLIE